MEEELTQLRDLVAQLQAENRRMRQERGSEQPGTSAAATASSNNGHSAVSAPATERLIYIPRERKCPWFNGKTGIGIAEWVEEVQACLRVRHLSPADQALFIYDHLEGEPREEIKYRLPEEKDDPEKILTILQELYGCTKSYVSLQEEFFSRRQQEGETLQEFSHALMCLMDRVAKQSPHVLLNKDVLLRDQFVENVLDCFLRRELKQYVRSHPTTTLMDVRHEAILWERGGMPGGGRDRSYSVPPALGFQHTVQEVPFRGSPAGIAPYASEIRELKEILKSQQEQLNQLAKSLAALNSAPTPYPASRNKAVICRRCQKVGHFARECPSEPTVVPVQSAGTATQVSLSNVGCSSMQENFHPLNH
ncbi:carboxypeptidase B2 [Sarotherodon galilaeus]